jgi:hypothetical protein
LQSLPHGHPADRELLAQLGEGDLAAWLRDTCFAARDLRLDLQEHAPRFVVRRLLARFDPPYPLPVVVADVPADKSATHFALDDFAHGRARQPARVASGPNCAATTWIRLPM